ncbi:hypothetical protein [Bradyrhizobium japonicum]|nr:hypothetical protein [Bradyrhizobium japonicum]MCP1964176.1 hypothetical protein [Bradyrhizobium japonicum]
MDRLEPGQRHGVFRSLLLQQVELHLLRGGDRGVESWPRKFGQ